MWYKMQNGALINSNMCEMIGKSINDNTAICFELSRDTVTDKFETETGRDKAYDKLCDRLLNNDNKNMSYDIELEYADLLDDQGRKVWECEVGRHGVISIVAHYPRCLNDIFYVEVTYEIEHVQKIDTYFKCISMRRKGETI